jgi:hypothetical protein
MRRIYGAETLSLIKAKPLARPNCAILDVLAFGDPIQLSRDPEELGIVNIVAITPCLNKRAAARTAQSRPGWRESGDRANGAGFAVAVEIDGAAFSEIVGTLAERHNLHCRCDRKAQRVAMKEIWELLNELCTLYFVLV